MVVLVVDDVRVDELAAVVEAILFKLNFFFEGQQCAMTISRMNQTNHVF